MKKSLIAACAVLACISAAHAQSSVTLSGLVDLYAGSMKMSGDPGRTAVVGSGGMTTSWFGFSGTEDLGGGYQAAFKLNSFQRLDTGTPGRFAGDNFFTRDASIALKTPTLGDVTIGRGLAPNFLPTILFNPFGDSFTFSPLVLHKNVGLFNGTGWAATTPSDTGWSNEIIYSAPKIAGISTNVHYQFGEQNSNSGNDSKKNVGINALWFSGNFALGGYYEHDQITNPTNALITAGTPALPATKKDWMLAGSYDAGFVKGFLTYGETKTDRTNLKAEQTSVGASAPIGAGKLLLAVAQTKLNLGAVDKRTTATIGYDYFLSKRTDLYLNAMHDKVETFGSGNSVAAGIRHRF